MKDLREVASFQKEIIEALKKIEKEKNVKEEIKFNELMENSNKGLEKIKKHLKSKSLSDSDFNAYLLKNHLNTMKDINN
jgi:hypothetical protein